MFCFVMAVFNVFNVFFLPSSGLSYLPSFYVNSGIKLTYDEHYSYCESLTLTTTPEISCLVIVVVTFVVKNIKTQLFWRFFCWHAPFGYPYFLYFQLNKNWVHKSILAWLWHRDSNPQPYDRESNLLTTRPDWRPFWSFFCFLLKNCKVIDHQ
jgi:hypothetical protein